MFDTRINVTLRLNFNKIIQFWGFDMPIFDDLGIEYIHHYAPLHYLPFIARSRSLKSKPTLRMEGFNGNHFRTKSKNSDVGRGFGQYAFLTLSRDPRIVKAKLKGGFPHLAFLVPVSSFANIDFDLCRYNVAMARRLLSSPTGGFKLDGTNGRYYGDLQLPIARTNVDKKRLLEAHYQAGKMIEVLVSGELHLSDETKVICYDQADLLIARTVLKKIHTPWEVSLENPPGPYNRQAQYAANVQTFINQSLVDPEWKGNGLEFDRV